MEENKTGFFDSFRKKVLANRMAIESVLFEKDKPKEKEKKDYKHIAYLSIAILTHFLFNFIYFFQNSSVFSYKDLKSFEYLNNYLNSTFFSILSFSELSYINFDMPLYYLFFWPFVKFMGLGYSYSLFVVNSLCIAAISLGIYFLLLESRNKNSALIGVLIFLSAPFTFELSRKFSPILLTSVFVTWSYYLYIKTEKFEKTNLIPLFLIVFSLGFLTDKFFIFYTFPILGFLSYLFTTVYSHLIVKIFLPIFIVSFIFYLRFIVLGVWYYFLQNPRFVFLNFKPYINFMSDSLGLIYFYIILFFFVWTFFASYMVYEPRKVLLKWFLYPFAIFSFFPFINKDLIFPIIIPLIVGSSVTFIPVFRKYFIYACVILGILNGLSLTGVLKYSDSRILGTEKNPFKKYHINELMLFIKEDLGLEKALDEVKEKNTHSFVTVSVNSQNDFINYYTFNSIKNKYGLQSVRFVRYPDSMKYFADYLITDANDDYSLKGVLNEIAKIENIRVFKKRSYYVLEPDKNTYSISELKIGDLVLKDILIYVYGFDQNKNFADYADLAAGYANYKGVDIYGIRLRLHNLRFSESFPTFINGFSQIDMISAKISDFSLIRTVEDSFDLKDLQIEFLNNIIKIKFNLMGKEITTYSYLTVKDNKIFFSVLYVDLGYFRIPKFLCSFLNFTYDLNRSNIPLKINEIKIYSGIIELK